MDLITKKNILLISPQPWGVLHVSKHHYAIELAKHNNVIYFLNPPGNNAKGTEIKEVEEYPGIFIINYTPVFPFWIRFKFRLIYDLLIQIQIKKILRLLPQKPDITWCFELNLFSNLCWFGSKINIYHPVDPVIYPYQYKPAKTADVVFSVSEKILSGFRKYNPNCFFINHGISKGFEEFAHNNLKKESIEINRPIKIGYVGNLLRGIIDHTIVSQLIKNHPEVEFHFWGPFKPNSSNLSEFGDQSVNNFIKFLTDSPNVYLHGPKSAKLLIDEIAKMDGFLLIYREKPGESDRSNAHKILEYLATGKVVICNRISTYENYGHLLQMPKNNDDSALTSIFYNTIQNINEYNSNDKFTQRIELACSNTYTKHLENIENLLSTIIYN